MTGKRKVAWLLIPFVAVMIVIQFIPVDRSNPPKLYADPLELDTEAYQVLRSSCYDCHSNVTSWPWYSRIAPLSWLLARDVREGREHLNFTNWHLYSGTDRAELSEEIMEQVTEGTMPPRKYILLHPEAELTADEIAELESWVRGRLVVPSRQ